MDNLSTLPGDNGRSGRSTKRGILTGAAFLVLAILVQWFLFPSIWTLGATLKSPLFIYSLTYATAALFFVGWGLIGVALKPHGSTWLGLGLAIALYTALGFVYVAARFRIFAHPTMLLVLVLAMKEQPRLLLDLALWPMSIVGNLHTLLFPIK